MQNSTDDRIRKTVRITPELQEKLEALRTKKKFTTDQQLFEWMLEEVGMLLDKLDETKRAYHAAVREKEELRMAVASYLNNFAALKSLIG